MLKKIPPIFLFFCTFAFAQDTIADLRIEKKGESAYVDGIDLSKKFKINLLWQSELGILQIGTSKWTLGNAWVSVKDTSFLLQTPVQKKILSRQSFWLPLPSSLAVFEKMLGKSFEYDSASAKIIAKQAGDTLPYKPPVAEDSWRVNIESRNNGEILEIKMPKAYAAEAFHAKPNYILRINGVSIDLSLFQDLAKKSVFINRAIPIQDEQSAQLTLVLKDNCENPELLKKDGGKTLQIVLRKKITAKAEASNPKAEAATQSKKIKTVVIDPGHGGRDPGAIGHNGLREKDIVLSVAAKTKKKLEENGFTVKLTRSTDEFVELGRRPKMASDWGGDLFLSLHCDAVPGKERQQKTEGFKFYILRAGGSEEDKAIARRENQAIALESGKKNKTEISPAEWIVLDNQLALYAERSALLAGYLVEAFDGGSIKKSQTGAGQAGFMVLVGAYMPAVLAELGFITNPKDAEVLSSEKGQNDIADKLTKAVMNFAQ